MADITGRADANFAQRLDNADLHGKKQRLRYIGARNCFVIGAGFEKLGDRPAEFGTKQAIDTFHSTAKCRVAEQCIARHADELCAVTRKDKGERALPNSGASEERRRSFVCKKPGKAVRHRGRIPGKRDQSMRMLVTPAGGRPQERWCAPRRNLGEHGAPTRRA